MCGNSGRGGCIQVKEGKEAAAGEQPFPAREQGAQTRPAEGKPALSIQTIKLEDWEVLFLLPLSLCKRYLFLVEKSQLGFNMCSFFIFHHL